MVARADQSRLRSSASGPTVLSFVLLFLHYLSCFRQLRRVASTTTGAHGRVTALTASTAAPGGRSTEADGRSSDPVEEDHFPYGVSSFVGIRKNKRFFVEKTEGILRLLRESENLIFLRPLRWGKTITLGILEKFLDKNLSDDEFETLRGPRDVFGPQIRPPLLRDEVRLIHRRRERRRRGDPAVGLYKKVNEKVARRYGLDDVQIDESDALASLESAAMVLRDSDAELFILVDEYDRFSNELRTCPITRPSPPSHPT